jgi:hypothetical protein
MRSLVETGKVASLRPIAVINVLLYAALLEAGLQGYYVAEGFLPVEYASLVWFVLSATVGIAVNIGLISYSDIAYHLSMVGWILKIVVLSGFFCFEGPHALHSSYRWSPWGWYQYAWAIPVALVAYKLMSIVYFRTKQVKEVFNAN